MNLTMKIGSGKKRVQKEEESHFK
ncbi:uncharacterized protein METZ01_LOCUS243963 [marine metagenome]|uniref:Uncharacterized protein n=1 Tax=marine metagenome TaxID=408172 RepID=A0A382HVB0_9ZZZZ